MKLIKGFMFVCVFLFMAMSVNANLNDNITAYYNFDNSSLTGIVYRDVTDNGFNTTSNNAVSGVDGKILEAVSYNGVDETIELPSNLTLVTPWAINFWANVTGTDAGQVLLSKNQAGANNDITIEVRTGEFFFSVDDGATGHTASNSSIDPRDSIYHMWTVTYDTTTIRGYYDGILSAQVDCTGCDIISTTKQWEIAQDRNATQMNGSIDELGFWERNFTQEDVTEIFNSNIGLSFPFFSGSLLTTNVKALYNTSTIEVQINSTKIINLSYSLDGAAEVVVWTNQNNGSVNISSISEGDHNITWVGATDNLTENFTIDLTAPSLNVSNFSEVNSYGFNFSSVINASLINISSCVVVTDESSTICTNESYTFITNGNHTYNVTLTDLAGNVNISLNNIAFINPLQNFSFFNTTGSPISNYTFGGLFFNVTLAQIPVYGSVLSLGNNTLLFEKLGFASTNVSFNVNLTSNINLSTNITSSVIVLRFFDRETLILITGTTTVTLVGSTGFNATTTTGTINITDINFIPGSYQVIASNPAYETESIFFIYDNQEILTKDLFLLKTNSTDLGTVTIQLTASTGQFVQGAICSALEWTPAQSAFLSVAEGNTNTEGSTILNIEIGTKLYKFSCTKSGTTVTSPQQIIQVSGSLVPLVLPVGEAPPELLLKNFVSSLTNTTFNATHQRITYNFTSTDNLVTEACLNQYQINGNTKILLNQTCIESSTGQIQVIININTTFSQLMEATAEEDGVVRVVDEIPFLGQFSLQNALSAYGMDVFIPLLLTILGIVIGFMIVPASISVSLFVTLVAMWLTRFFVPSIMSYSSTIFMSVVLLIMLWGSKK